MELFENVDYKQFFADVRVLYESLEDELSKELFLNRVHLANIGLINEYKRTDVTDQIRKQQKERFPHFDNECKVFESLPLNETIIFYGIGGLGDIVLQHYDLTTKSHPNIIFCDQKGDTIRSYHKFPVITPEELIQKYTSHKIYILTHVYQQEVTDYLLSNGIKKENINDNLTINGENLIRLVLRHCRTFHADTSAEQYFDEVVQFGVDEVFVDVGVFDADTSLRFAKYCPNYKKIYMFEPDPESYAVSHKNITEKKLERSELIQCGLYNEKTTITFDNEAYLSSGNHISETGNISIDVDTLDHFFIDNASETPPPTFIKMDIEGAELAALQGGEQTIKKYKPKLAISIYHKEEDVLELFAYIKNLVPEYKFYIRHYSSWNTETVLYAIPPNK